MKPTILIVDDYKDTRELMGRALDEEYSTVLAPDAEGAMKALAADPSIALMLSDVRMPGTDGVTLLKTVKATYPELAVILLTAYGTVDLAVEAMKEGADDFLTKPVDLDQLEMRVKKVLETRRLKSEVADLHRQLDEKYGMENLSYGDLLFTDSEYNHVGIYIGGGMMIHAPTFGRTVCVYTVWSCYGGGPFVMP